MPTYTYRCDCCGELAEAFLSMREYITNPPTFICCTYPMSRFLVPPTSPLVLEADYTGLRASDGTDISSRAKHREYMRRHNLTTVDDYRNTWAKDARERAARLAGEDPTRRQDVANAYERLRDRST